MNDEEELRPSFPNPNWSQKKDEPEPWWNDGDKVAGLAATICILLLLGIAGAGVVWLWQLVL